MASELVGVISDTHGLLRPEAVSALEGCHCIIHAGDIGKPEVLEQLRELAPVYAVRGNVDSGSWARALPAQRELEVRGKRLYVLHDVSELDFEPATRGYAAVISGHSHQPRQELREGVLYLNPGSAGPRRFKLPIAL
ncbi:MAG TPA: metallophosphoesterase family protein, partial [Polyangiaceae bacterium]|nr:metallophosphoesterase family protein [Polyangiaceae bacterium]